MIDARSHHLPRVRHRIGLSCQSRNEDPPMPPRKSISSLLCRGTGPRSARQGLFGSRIVRATGKPQNQNVGTCPCEKVEPQRRRRSSISNSPTSSIAGKSWGRSSSKLTSSNLVRSNLAKAFVVTRPILAHFLRRCDAENRKASAEHSSKNLYQGQSS